MLNSSPLAVERPWNPPPYQEAIPVSGLTARRRAGTPGFPGRSWFGEARAFRGAWTSIGLAAETGAREGAKVPATVTIAMIELKAHLIFK
jgi:hypothetical protein